jgi:glycerol-3-phosphate dehydrogenase
MWEKGWRETTWTSLDQEWDILIIGGGITGAGIFRRAVAEGYRTLLIEAGDFASGTSSRSSKLVHGGFRYLRNKQFSVTRESVREREWMLREAKNLVKKLGFIMPSPPDRKISAQFAIGVVLYDLLAPKWEHKTLYKKKLKENCPLLDQMVFNKAYLYYDSEMDDARLVYRMIRETALMGGTALNYTKVTNLMRNKDGKVSGVVINDLSSEKLGDKEVKARVVINATGPWSDEIRRQVGAPARLRKLRGSHLIFSRERLPLKHAVTLLHPIDCRAMFAIPWEGVSLIGTTDLDHTYEIDKGEPFCTAAEIDYILAAGNATFPSLALTQSDVISSFSGLRPVINTGIADPSKESRAHVVWDENGMITITGGKLTTFRIMAEEALAAASPYLPNPIDLSKRVRYFNKLPSLEPKGELLTTELAYLLGRYGEETNQLISAAQKSENQPIETLPNLWSELRWAARTGAIEHLDDLMLRRVRLGMQLPDGGKNILPAIKSICQPELGWDDEKWQAEVTRYLKIYVRAYSPSPEGYN